MMKKTTICSYQVIKKVTIAFALILYLPGCDSPRGRKTGIVSSKNGLTGQSGFNFADRTGASGNGTNAGENSSTNTAGNINGSNNATTNTSNIPTDVKSDCHFSSDGVNGFDSVSAHLGAYTLCQSTADKNSFYFQLKIPPVDSTGEIQICFAPNTSSGAHSIAVGGTMCGHFNSPKSITKITFIKYSKFTNANINTLIFFKDSRYFYPVFNQYMLTSDAFSYCMNMLSYGQPSYCDAFKAVGQYVTMNF